MGALKKPDVVVVTGASAGVGRAIARRFAQDGCRIGLIARGVERLESTRREVEELGGRGLVLPLDVSDSAAVERAALRIEEELGEIDVWINNAMVTVFAPVKETRPEEYRRVTEVTYLGAVHGTLAALGRMLPRDRGHIVQIGSALAYRSIPLQSAYCAAKHAIQGFTESLRTELLHDESGVQLSVVDLPAVNTPQFEWSKSRMPRKAQPVPPIYQPELIADAVRHVAEHPRRTFLVTGSTMKAVWGNKVAPALADRYLAKKGYSSQMRDEPEDPDRPDNLWEPVEGDPGAHGVFDDRAKDRSVLVWANKHRAALGLVTAGLAGVGIALGLRRGPAAR